MPPHTLASRRASVADVSRRDLLTGALAGAAAFAASRPVAATARGGKETSLAYVGCYTPNGLGIYLFRVEADGDLTPIKVFPTPIPPSPTNVSTRNPSWLSFNPKQTHLYVANEISNFNGTTTGAVSAFSVNKSDGELTFLNTVSSQGGGPAHLSVDPSGGYVLVSNYGGGNCAVLPILAGGSLGSATDVQADVNQCTSGPCPLGPINAEKAPPGSFARSGHDAPHAHMIETDPAGNFAISTDLGLDIVIIRTFDSTTGKLLAPKTFPTSKGAGPRHFAFHPNGRWFYLLNEEASTLVFMRYDASTGSLETIEEISTLPDGFVGTNFTSEIRVSPNGAFIYAANRLHDTIAIFSIERNGRPELIDEEWTRGDYPRSFNIDPSGRYMYVCNQRSDAITTFKVLGNGRRLKFADRYTPVGSPATIIFL